MDRQLGAGQPIGWQQAIPRRRDRKTMTLTKKDLEDVSKTSDRCMAVVNVLVRVLRPVSRLGFVRRLISRTASGRVGAISRYTERGEHDRAADIAIELLKENRHQPAGTWKPSGRDYWWMYMSFAAESLEQCDAPEKRAEVIEMARNGVEPGCGYFVARSFLAFSRWKYREGDCDAALEFAEIAASADDTWAEPDFVLGWYRSVTGRGDATEHLARAVRKDRRILPRIEQDPVCGRHPHIIKKLKNLSFDDRVAVRDGAGAEADKAD